MTETCRNNFNIDFNISFKNHLEQSKCAFSWISKRLNPKIFFKIEKKKRALYIQHRK